MLKVVSFRCPNGAAVPGHGTRNAFTEGNGLSFWFDKDLQLIRIDDVNGKTIRSVPISQVADLDVIIPAKAEWVPTVVETNPLPANPPHRKRKMGAQG